MVGEEAIGWHSNTQNIAAMLRTPQTLVERDQRRDNHLAADDIEGSSDQVIKIVE